MEELPKRTNVMEVDAFNLEEYDVRKGPLTSDGSSITQRKASALFSQMPLTNCELFYAQSPELFKYPLPKCSLEDLADISAKEKRTTAKNKTKPTTEPEAKVQVEVPIMRADLSKIETQLLNRVPIEVILREDWRKRRETLQKRSRERSSSHEPISHEDAAKASKELEFKKLLASHMEPESTFKSIIKGQVPYLPPSPLPHLLVMTSSSQS